MYGFGGSGQPAATDPENDILWALVRWVEMGRAPERLTSTRMEGGDIRFTRALCPFPKSAHYNGTGLTEAAASYTCRSDPSLVRLLSARGPE